MMRAGCLILFGIGIHNLPEGLVIGAGLESSPEFGMDIALAIAPQYSGRISNGRAFESRRARI